MPDNVLLTGSTGYIGSSLLKKWLDSSDAHLTLLVRDKRGERASKRIEGVLSDLYSSIGKDHFKGRIDVLEGDVSLERFGLKESEYGDLAAEITHILHCAAAARFDLDLGDARKTNVGGTRNILDLAMKCRGLQKIDYIGTAYVAGKREGLVKEDELDVGQEHNNTYEASKLEAEKLVREHFGELPLSIFRPSIVICDSRTGRSSSFNGFYRALRMYWLSFLKTLPGYPTSSMDLIPVDYVTDALYAISGNPDSAGKCYHLTAGPGNATTLEEISELASRYFGKEKFVIIPPEIFSTYLSKMENALSDEERGMINELRLYMPYLTAELQFDDSNTRNEFSREVPKVCDYFGKMAKYIMMH